MPSTLYTIDRATGAVTEVGPLGVDLDPADVSCGLAIDAVDGTLYAGAYDGTLYTVDKRPAPRRWSATAASPTTRSSCSAG